MGLKHGSRQMSLIKVNVETLVSKGHIYRDILRLVDFEKLSEPIQKLYSVNGRKGYSAISVLKMLCLQFFEDLSDRQMERYLEENLAAKYFCGFGIEDQTPDFRSFTVFRSRIGTKTLADIFNGFIVQLKADKTVRTVFTFVDSSQIKSRIDVWEARDKFKQDDDEDGNNSLNNSNIGKYSSDKEAKFGCKGKNKFWIGYKRHVAVDMPTGIITKVAVTPANISDADGLKHVCPKQGMVLADKAYSIKKAQKILKINNCHSGVIKKNNQKDKDFKKDSWLTKIRMPSERVFSKQSKLARYRGKVKTQFQTYMQAFAINFKALIRLFPKPVLA